MQTLTLDMFLSDEEVVRLTGRRWPSLQIEQLIKQRIPFHTNAVGRPIVMREMLAGMERKAPSATSGWSPNKRE